MGRAFGAICVWLTACDTGTGDELTPALDQQDQEVHGLAPDLHRSPMAPQHVSGDVQREVAEAERLARNGRVHNGG